MRIFLLALVFGLGLMVAPAMAQKGKDKPEDKAKSSDKGKPDDKGGKPDDKGGKPDDKGGKPDDKGGKPDDKGKTGGKADDAKAKARAKQAKKIEQDHLRRLAKLERIQEIAKEKKNDELLAKVGELIKKEAERYDRLKKKLAEKGSKK